jgi:hypothetical protein
MPGSVPEWQQGLFEAIMEALHDGHYRPPIMGWSAVDKYVNLAFKDIDGWQKRRQRWIPTPRVAGRTRWVK